MSSVHGFFRKLNRGRKDWTKRFRCFLIALRYRRRSALQPHVYKTVCLLLQDHGIGDAIVVSGLIRRLQVSGRKVIVVTNPRSEPVFRHMVPNDAVVVWSKKNHRSALREIRTFGVDLVIDFAVYQAYNKLHRVKLIASIRPLHTIGFNGTDTSLQDTSIATRKNEHVTERVKRVLEQLNLSISDYKYEVCFDPGQVRDSTEFVMRLRKKYRHIIVLNPFGGSPDRCLSGQQIHVLSQYLDGLPGVVTVVFDLNRQLDLDSYRHVMKNPFADLDNSFNLVRLADTVISVDTSIVHLAAAFNILQFAIYNNRITSVNNNNLVWGPNSDNAVQLTTSQQLGRSGGDDMTRFDVSVLIKAIRATHSVL